ncbi:MAG: hypothetical protein A2138_01025 [Deltaproteobacteria bacterium RBG_16_71_12]|nr:MAG: hypothetical protein A2138_01025 [Deltaproteobacteria bacterium RBG_16_71_12]
MRIATRALVAVLAVPAAGCSDPPIPEVQVVVDEALRRDLETIKAARVFFGHQSVGHDVLEGVAALAREAGVDVAIGEGQIGANGKPEQKFDDFAKRAEAGPELDVIAMKLCYVDLYRGADPDQLLAGYRSAVARVRQARPNLKILHVTTPLTIRATTAKASIKRLLGGSSHSDDSNAVRLAYNRGLRAAFPGEPVFDLAAVESTRPDGSREELAVKGQPVPMLWPGYAADEGHLNAPGKRVAARAFIAALAEALRR